MIIGIDGNEANVGKRVGIGEYGFELLKQFKGFKIKNLKFKIYLKSTPLQHMPFSDINWEYKIVKPTKFWTQFGLPLSLFKDNPRPDVFFSPTHYAPRFSSVPTVIAVMDLSYIHYPEMFAKRDLVQLRSWTKYSIKNAQKIFTISQSSKSDIINYYQLSENKVVVTYPGIKTISNIKYQMSNIKSIQKKYGISDKFILFVGTIQPRKNLNKLIEAFGLISRKHSDIQLVIIGKKGWLYRPILSAPKEFGIEDRVKFLDFVPDEDLKLFYAHAVCYCLPSLYEGFGLPVLEAMQLGCPVIISSVSSLPEAGGDGALYVDPGNAKDIADKISEIVDNKTLRDKLIKKGFEQVKKFSWEKTAKETLRVLQEVAENA